MHYTLNMNLYRVPSLEHVVLTRDYSISRTHKLHRRSKCCIMHPSRNRKMFKYLIHILHSICICTMYRAQNTWHQRKILSFDQLNTQVDTKCLGAFQSKSLLMAVFQFKLPLRMRVKIGINIVSSTIKRHTVICLQIIQKFTKDVTYMRRALPPQR